MQYQKIRKEKERGSTNTWQHFYASDSDWANQSPYMHATLTIRFVWKSQELHIYIYIHIVVVIVYLFDSEGGK